MGRKMKSKQSDMQRWQTLRYSDSQTNKFSPTLQHAGRVCKFNPCGVLTAGDPFIVANRQTKEAPKSGVSSHSEGRAILENSNVGESESLSI